MVDHGTNETMVFSSSGALVADNDANSMPVVFTSDNAGGPPEGQDGNSALVTGSAGSSPANSLLIDPGKAYRPQLQSMSEVPGDGTALTDPCWHERH
ncbi:MAG: hypothetical protein ACRDY0_02285 [Acidimicrobiales bacterium]